MADPNPNQTTDGATDVVGEVEEGIAGPLPDYAALLAARHVAHAEELRSIVSRLPTDKAARVLDAPCGDGFYSACFAAELSSDSIVVAVDIDRTFLVTARELIDARPKPAAIGYVQGDSYRLPFSDDTFDLAWCAQSLLSLKQPVEAITELRRVARRSGMVAVLEEDRVNAITLPWPADLDAALHDAQRRELEGLLEDHAAETNPVRQTLTWLREAGLDSCGEWTFSIRRAFPLAAREAEFLGRYFAALRDRVSPFLEERWLRQYDELTQPESPAYLPRQRDFEMTWQEILTVGVK